MKTNRCEKIKFEFLSLEFQTISRQLISFEAIESNSARVNVKNYTNGAYLITISSSNKTWKTTFVKE